MLNLQEYILKHHLPDSDYILIIRNHTANTSVLVNTTYQSSTCNYGSDGNCSLNGSQTKSFSNGLKANLKTDTNILQKDNSSSNYSIGIELTVMVITRKQN
jgi:hypothetical protein